MKFLFDLFPIILFFAAYQLSGNNIFLATGVTIVATIGQVLWSWFKHKHVDKMLWVSLVIVTVMGGATLLFHNKTFIYWKPTALYWAMGLGLLVSRFAFKKDVIRAMMQEQISLPEAIWFKLMLAWVAFFAVMGSLNLYVVYHYPEDIWVKFKLFGTLACTVVFVLAQGLLLSPHIQENKDSTQS